MSREPKESLEKELWRIKKLTRENDRLLAQMILRIEDLHAANESLKAKLLKERELRQNVRSRAAQNGAV